MKDIGVTVIKKIDENFLPKLQNWLEYGMAPNVHYPDITGEIIANVVTAHKDLVAKAV
jgi:hypothetical protein